MGKDYEVIDIESWKDEIPYDKEGHALCPETLYDSKGKRTNLLPVKALQATNPLGINYYKKGNENNFACLDFRVFSEGVVAIHSVISSTSQDDTYNEAYKLVPVSEAMQTAKEIIQHADSVLSKIEKEISFNNIEEYLRDLQEDIHEFMLHRPK